MGIYLNDKMELRGEFKIFTKQVKETEWNLRREGTNICVNLSRNLARDNLFGTQSYYVNWGAVSDNTDTPVAADTSLTGNEVRNSMQSGYPNLATNYQAKAQYYITATDWAGGSPSALTTVSKAGLYFQSTGNYLFCAAKFDAITVNATTEMLIEWTVSFSDA